MQGIPCKRKLQAKYIINVISQRIQRAHNVPTGYPTDTIGIIKTP